MQKKRIEAANDKRVAVVFASKQPKKVCEFSINHANWHRNRQYHAKNKPGLSSIRVKITRFRCQNSIDVFSIWRRVTCIHDQYDGNMAFFNTLGKL
jgi:hypothetical protein